LERRNATAAVIGAGDFIGGSIAKKFAAEGFTVFVGRRNGDKLAPLVGEVEAAGGRIVGRSLDARKEDEIATFLRDAEAIAPLDVCVFNIGANVNFPLLETTERVFRKVWELACYSGFLAGREAARLMLPRGRGNIFFTGATASLRGGVGYAAFASAKFGLRAVAESAARELGPKGIHVAHLNHRRRGRYRLGARTDQGTGRRGGACQSRSRPADAPRRGRRCLLADLPGAGRRLVVRARDSALRREMVSP
jgi:NAD(P)-dependent dehydrogenase (short-subunit alcohol dehydrogenase family)